MIRIIAIAALALPAGAARAQHGASASNPTLLGHEPLQARSAYQPVIHQQGRWIAHLGHHGGKTLNPLSGREEDNGTPIVDRADTGLHILEFKR